MKQLLQICMALFLVSCGNNGKTTSLEDFNLKGAVSSVKSISYYAESKFGETTKGPICHFDNFQYKFNDNGMTSEITTFNENGGICSKEIYTYNDDELVDATTYDSYGDICSKVVFEYIDHITVNQSHYDSEGNLEHKIKFENDGKNITKGEEIVSEHDCYHWTNTWDGDRLVEIINSNSDGETESKTTFTREGQISKINYDDFVVSLSYNNFNDVVLYDNAKPIGMGGFSTYKGEAFCCEYEYDSHNNWVKRITYSQETKIPQRITEREIIYFD